MGKMMAKVHKAFRIFFFFLLCASAARGCECVAGGALKSEEVRKLNEFV